MPSVAFLTTSGSSNGSVLSVAPTTMLTTPQIRRAAGIALAASGTMLVAAPRADPPPTPQPVLMAGSTGMTAPSGTQLFGAAPRADVPVTHRAAPLAGAQLPAAGSVLAAAPRADFITPPPNPALYAGVVASTPIEFVSPAPSTLATPLPPSVVLLAGATLAAEGAQLFGPALRTDLPPTHRTAPLAGAVLPAAGTILAAAPRADLPPTPFSSLYAGVTVSTPIEFVVPALAPDMPLPPAIALLTGAMLAASGAQLLGSPIPTDLRPTHRSAPIPGATLPAAGTVLSAALRADVPPTPTLSLYTGTPVVMPLIFVAPAPATVPPPTPLVALIPGGTLAASGTPLLGPPPSADMPLTPLIDLLPGYTLAPEGGMVFGAAPSADMPSTPAIELLAGATPSAAGTILAAPLATDVPPVPPQPVITPGATLAAAGSMFFVVASPVPQATTQLLAGFTTSVFATELSLSAERVPGVTPALLGGFAIATAAGPLAPFTSEQIPTPPLPVLIPGASAAPPPPPPPSPGPQRSSAEAQWRWRKRWERIADEWAEQYPGQPPPWSTPDAIEVPSDQTVSGDDRIESEADYTIVPVGDSAAVRAMAAGIVRYVHREGAGLCAALAGDNGVRYLYVGLGFATGGPRHVAQDEVLGFTPTREQRQAAEVQRRQLGAHVETAAAGEMKQWVLTVPAQASWPSQAEVLIIGLPVAGMLIAAGAPLAGVVVGAAAWVFAATRKR